MPEDADLEKAKHRARALGLARRQAARTAADPSYKRQIADRFMAEFPDVLEPGTAVSGYVAIGDEADPGMLLQQLASKSCRLCLPRVAEPDAPLIFGAWAPGDPLRRGPHSTWEPDPQAEVVVPAVILLPLVAFDGDGGRLGYGGGYYDRTLAALRGEGVLKAAIGVAFAGQELEELPRGAHDQRLDGIVTEKGARRF